MYKIDVQNPEDYSDIPNIFIINRWAKQTLSGYRDKGEITIRFVSKDESKKLNYSFRQKNKPTNVLSFPMKMPEGVDLEIPLIGDLVICRDIVVKEAKEQNKPLEAHFAHMIIHGILHLLGFDHIKAKDAKVMEPIEINLLEQLGFNNPYEISHETTDQ